MIAAITKKTHKEEKKKAQRQDNERGRMRDTDQPAKREALTEK